jgi:hypothetical protein
MGPPTGQPSLSPARPFIRVAENEPAYRGLADYHSDNDAIVFSDKYHVDDAFKRKLKKIHYRSHLIDGCLARTGLTIEPG